MKTSHTCPLALAVILTLAGCTVDGGAPAPTATPLAWADLSTIVDEAVSATGLDWQRQPDENPQGTCSGASGQYDDQALIPESSGRAVVFRGRVPASEKTSEGRRILRDRFEKPWSALGLAAEYESPSALFASGRVVATLDGSPQLLLSGSRSDDSWQLTVRAACYTPGLPAAQ